MQLSETRVLWEPDNSWPSCKICLVGFHFFRRRHHCRRCGSVVCNTCSGVRSRAPGYTSMQRCCKMCHTVSTKPQQRRDPPTIPSEKNLKRTIPTIEAMREQQRQNSSGDVQMPRVTAEQQSSNTEATLLPPRVTNSTNTLPETSFHDFNRFAKADSDDDSDNDIFDSPISNNNSIALKANSSSLQMGLQVLQVTMQSRNHNVTINVTISPLETVQKLIDRLADQMWSLVYGVRRSRKHDEFIEFKRGLMCTNELSVTLSPDVPLANIAMERHSVFMCAPGVSTFSFGSQVSTGSPTPTSSATNFFLRHSFPSAPPEMVTHETEIFE